MRWAHANVVRKIVVKALERYGAECKEFLPDFVLKSYDYPQRSLAFRVLHDPKPGEGAPTDIAPDQPELFSKNKEEMTGEFLNAGDPSLLWERSRRRLAFEEFFLHQFILRQFSGLRKKKRVLPIPSPNPIPGRAAKASWTPTTAETGPLYSFATFLLR